MELDKNKVSLPLIVTRGFIMFPHNNASLDIIKEESERAVNKAHSFFDGYLILSSQINTKISDIDVENKDYYSARADEYKLKLDELDKSFAQTVANAKTNKMIFGDSFAFLYFRLMP